MARFAWILAAAALATAVVPGVRAVSRSYLFPKARLTAIDLPADFARSRTFARDGVPVDVLELPAPPGGRTVVHFHNNRDTVEAFVPIARTLRARGLGVALVEYRGYGTAAERAAPDEPGLYADADAALAMLHARGVRPNDIVLWGTSLGTGVAAEMARRGHGGRLILVTPYTSIPDLVTDVVSFVPARALLSDHFDTLAKAGSIAVPSLIVHGDADEIVPFWMGERLVKALGRARLVRVNGGRHGDLFAREPERLLAEIVSFAS